MKSSVSFNENKRKKQNKDKENINLDTDLNHSSLNRNNKDNSLCAKINQSLLLKEKKTNFTSLSVNMIGCIFEFMDNISLLQSVKLNRKSKNIVTNKNLLFKYFLQFKDYIKSFPLRLFEDERISFQSIIEKYEQGLTQHQIGRAHV